MDCGTSALITGLVSGIGVGSVVTAGIQYFIKRKETSLDSQRKDLEARYKVVILLMYGAFAFKKSEAFMRNYRPDLSTPQAVLDELVTEWHNMTLFASGKTLDALRAFIHAPSEEAFASAALAMRGDLGRGYVDLKF